MGKEIDFSKPEILYENYYTYSDLAALKNNNKIWKIYDLYEKQLVELFQITYPSIINTSYYKRQLNKFIQKKIYKKTTISGNWIYFPWNGNLIHSVNEEDYFLLRTNRNRNLITINEQKKLYNSTIGIIGLSVGSGVAQSLAYQGIARNMKLAEFDNLETTNLNRIKAHIYDIGLPKLEIASQLLYEINPYQKLTLFPKGILLKNLNDFISQEPKPKIIFEIIDDFEMKIHVRLKAKKLRIPVVMVANLGDTILVDIERYDIDKSLPLFNGLLGDLPKEILKNPNVDRNIYAVKIVGLENIPKRALESVKEINKTLTGRPQLANTVSISGSICSYIAKEFLQNALLPSGRRIISLQKILKV